MTTNEANLVLLIRIMQQINTIIIIIILLRKKPINADYSTLSENTESNLKASKLKVNDRVRITTYKNIFSEGCTKNQLKEIFIIDIVLKTNPWT